MFDRFFCEFCRKGWVANLILGKGRWFHLISGRWFHLISFPFFWFDAKLISVSCNACLFLSMTQSLVTICSDDYSNFFTLYVPLGSNIMIKWWKYFSETPKTCYLSCYVNKSWWICSDDQISCEVLGMVLFSLYWTSYHAVMLQVYEGGFSLYW